MKVFGKEEKRRRLGSSGDEGSDGDIKTPPPSPKDGDEVYIEKRRSSRVTKRKKYNDEVEYGLSDEERKPRKADAHVNMADAVKPMQYFVAADDEAAGIVDKILAVRIGRRKKLNPPPPEPEIQKEEVVKEQHVMHQLEKVDESVDVDIEMGDAERATAEAEEKPVVEDAAAAETETPKEEPPPTPVAAEEEGEREKVAESAPEKTVEKPAESGDKGGGAEKENEEEEEWEEVEEFFIKYKNFSYLHCEWAAEDQLRDKRIVTKIKRFKQKQQQNPQSFYDMEDEPFNPEYVVVDRVLDESITPDPITGIPVTYYLVKWSSLPYEDSTWELAEDVDIPKIEQFKKFREMPAEEYQKPKKRPRAERWKKLEESLAYKGGNVLRDYQLEGVNWLSFCWHNKQNCILADEMGLGKTVQSIAFLLDVEQVGITGPFLIIAPLSTIPNWQREFETWSDINTIVYHGTAASRNMIREYEMYYKNEKGEYIMEFFKFQALITTYEVVISDCFELREIPWRVVIIDEAHRLKNQKCKLMEGLKLLNVEHRVLLSGTPLQNNVQELFSLLNFLEAQQFSCIDAFLKEFGDLKTEGQVEKLQQILKPMMLRRLKEDVEKTLAPKEETIIEVELTNIQKKYYRAIIERNFAFLSKGASWNNVPNLMNTMMELRKCCNHPYLIKGAEEKILNEYHADHSEDSGLHLQAMIQSSGKLVLIDKLLPKLKQDGHKVLVFSQMVRCLDILEDYLIKRMYPFERIDGGIRGDLRQAAIDRFSKPDSDRFVFLLCTRAGGLGINLVAADTVIIFDSDWNPQNDLQAQARCHRIGQTQSVKVYRLITRNSYEREMFDKASLKLGLDKAVLQTMRSEKEKENCTVPCLEGSTFSEASFASSGNRTDIDIDDPNFWQKWAKKADIDVDKLGRVSLSGPVPRGRKGRKSKKELAPSVSEHNATWITKFEPEILFQDNGYKKHLRRHANKVLLRVRLLYYIWLEVIGREADKVLRGLPASFQNLTGANRGCMARWLIRWRKPSPTHVLVSGHITRILNGGPRGTIRQVGSAATLGGAVVGRDRCTLGGAVVGYERCTLGGAVVGRDRCTPRRLTVFEDADEKAFVCVVVPPRGRLVSIRISASFSMLALFAEEEGKLAFPGASDFNNRLRKLITGYQRNYKKQLLQRDTEAKRCEKRLRAQEAMKVREQQKRYQQQRWSRREEADFYRVVSSFGVEYNKKRKEYDWRKFKALARLDKKFDHSITDYFLSFMTMCKAVCRKELTAEEAAAAQLVYVAPITEERAGRCLYRIKHCESLTLLLCCKLQRCEKRLRAQEAMKVREQQKRYQQQRWSRREEADFYRVVSSFGVEYNKKRKEYDWRKFKALARLDKKFDHSITDYFLSFMTMCKAVCRKELTAEEAAAAQLVYVAPITEERAGRCLYRIKLLNKVRAERVTYDARELSIVSFIDRCLFRRGKEETEEVEKEKGGVSEGTDEQMEDVKTEEQAVEVKEEATSKEAEDEETEKRADEKEQHADEKEKHADEKEKHADEKEKHTDEKEKHADEKEGEAALVKTEEAKPKIEAREEEEEEEVCKEGEDAEEKPVKKEEEAGEEEAKETAAPKEEQEEETASRLGGEMEEEVASAIPAKIREMMRLEQGSPLGTDDESQASFMESDGERNPPTVAQLLAHSMHNPIRWPKDKVLMHRIEHICYCVEHGQWPARHPAIVPQYYSATPGGGGGGGGGTPTPGTPQSPYGEYGRQAGGGGSGGGGGSAASTPRSATPMSSPAVTKVRASLGRGSGKRRGKGGGGGEQRRQQQTPGDREQVTQHTIHIPVINVEDGSILRGEGAPTASNLSQWLAEHPGYIVSPSHLFSPSSKDLADRKHMRRKHRLDPAQLDPDQLTGEENVSVINKLTGQKITGRKAPPLKHLAEWLKKNPDYDVESKWGHLVRAKGYLPDTLKSRIQSSRRKRGGGGVATATTAAAAAAENSIFPPSSNFAALSSLMSAYPGLALPPYLGLANPYLAANYGFTGKDGGEDGGGGGATGAATSIPMIFPSPGMLMNPLFAQSLGGFSLPSNMPTSFASLLSTAAAADAGVEGATAARRESEAAEAWRREKDSARLAYDEGGAAGAPVNLSTSSSRESKEERRRRKKRRAELARQEAL
ncbi:PREDICTED: chromodomain-helicase-DNA-binding protein 7-like [Priapulus caudatus]|uniref:Chromodomain-helicase-DNA-binding protein 7-like n=1 Tax=Priapulus caudatus TaxID=37621 RepID=A0ABM1ECN9_PRICU|nr:PREDICTED: chromodomain-helicase-DNA-binding protein 7-like [Priapulus caudatus]